MPTSLFNSIQCLVVGISLLVAGTLRAEEVRSGLAPGEHPETFNVRDITGPAAGKTLCYTCRFGSRPVVGIFTRDVNDQLGQLLTSIDRQLAQHADQRMAAYVVLLAADTAAAERQLKDLARQHKLRRIPLTIVRDRRQRVEAAYRLSADAQLTVLMWQGGAVKANRGFRSLKLGEEDIQQVLSDTATIVGEPR